MYSAYFLCTGLNLQFISGISFESIIYMYSSFLIGFCLVQHVLIKPEVKGLDNEVAGPPPSEPK